MSAIKRIICPVDIYKFHQEVAEYALGLADSLNAKIFAVYVLEPIPLSVVVNMPALLEDDYEQTMLRSAEERMKEIISRFFRDDQDEGRIAVGHAADEIAEIAAQLSGDLIVISSHCRTVLCRALYGSVTNNVLAKAKIPVLVLRPKET